MMNKNVKILLGLYVLFMTVFAFSFCIKAAGQKISDSFPDSINAYYLDNFITYDNTSIYNKKFDDGARAFCTSFWYKAPYGSCSAILWDSSNTTENKKIATAIGAMLAKIRSLSGGTPNQIDADKYFYGEMAINYFLYNFNGQKEANDITRLPNWNKISNNTNYKDIYSAGVTAYKNYGKASIQFTEPSISVSADRQTVTASIILTCYDAKGNAVACSAVTKGTLTVTGTDANNNPVSQVLDATYTKETSPNIRYIYNYTYTFPTAFKEATQINGSFQTKNKVTYTVAQKYNCGNSYQPLTPNLTMKLYEYTTAKKSASVDTNNCIITINKTGEGGVALKGAKFNLYSDANGTTKIDSGTSNSNGVITFDGLVPGTYYYKEIQAPSGYILNNQLNSVTLTENNCNQELDISNEKATGSLKILKIDENGNAVVGAKIRVFTVPNNANFDFEEAMGSIENDTTNESGGENNSLDNNNYEFDYEIDPTTNNPYFITTTTPIEITGLTIGETYYVYEESVPENSDYSIKIGSGVAEIVDTNPVTVTLKNIHSHFKISKQDITTKKELPGATIQILDSRGLVIYEWVSTNEQKEILGLEDGQYTLVEITAPKGYKKAESIAFTIEDGKLKDDDNNVLVMYDDTEKFIIPDTLSARNILIVLAGLAIVAAGIGIFLYGVKKKDQI